MNQRYGLPFIILLICFFNCNSINLNDRNDRNDRKVNKVKITFVNLYITTFHSVECSQFESFFTKNVREKYINDLDEINKMSEYLKNQIPTNQITSIDTRFKIILYKSDPNLNDTICGDQFTFKLNEKRYSIDKNFLNYLKKVMN